MRWRTGRRSGNIEDRRGMGAGTGLRVGGVGGLGVVAIVLVAMFLGVDPSLILQSGLLEETGTTSAPSPEDDERAQFVSVVLADTEDTWQALFRANGGDYQEPQLVLFRGAVQSACGAAQSAVGPFYCPGDGKVYLDLDFFDELAQRFEAPGDFAQAYVVAHEIGHHVQNLLGISDQVLGYRQVAGEAESNRLSVMMELQADCFAGVWAHHADRQRQVLEPGDVEEGLRAASAVGDDTIQSRTQGYIVPDAFTHGSAEARTAWFRRGLENGSVDACDTYRAGQQ